MNPLTRKTLPARRAFALPVVMLIMIVIATVGVVMLERQGAQALAIGRQVSGYDEHHASRGMKEAIDAWITNGQRKPIRDRIDSFGRAFELDLPNGIDGKGMQTLTILLVDAQGTVLSDFTGFAGQALDDGRAILTVLRNSALPAEEAYLRAQGPISISANSATPEVLLAVAEAATGGEGAQSFVDEILKSRDEGQLNSAAIGEACNASGAEPEARAKLQRFITADPLLWMVTVEVRRGGPTGTLNARYRGLATLVDKSASRQNTPQGMQRSSVFLTWEKQDAQQIQRESMGL